MFYHIHQNNTCGFIFEDQKLAEDLLIEADSADEANNFAETLGIEFDVVECPCCDLRWDCAGERWKFSSPMAFFEREPWAKDSSYRIYFKNGKITMKGGFNTD